MIATALVFVLGALLAGLIALLFAPILWSNAQRLARREFDATIPVSVREMRGEIDALRAQSAFEMRQEAMRHRAMQETATRERAEAGRAILENGQLQGKLAELEDRMSHATSDAARLERELQALLAEREDLLRVRGDLHGRLERREGELAALDGRYHALSARFDEQRFRLAKAEARILELGAQLRPPPPVENGGSAKAHPASQLAPALAPLPAAAAVSPPSGSSRLREAISRAGDVKATPGSTDHREIRERIGDIAARIIHERIRVEGDSSPLARIIADAPPASDGDEPLLADRVRRLQAEVASTAASTPPPSVKENGAGRSRRKSRR